MRGYDMHPQVLLEVRHVFSNISQLRVTNETLSPSASIDRAKHDISSFLDRGWSSGDERALQFRPIDDQRLASQTQSAGLVQKDKPWRIEIGDVNHQRHLSNPGRGVADRSFREPLAHIGIQDEGISWPQ